MTAAHPLPPVDDDRALDRFRTLVRIPTVSRNDESAVEWEHFADFRTALADLYPAAHTLLEREIIAEHSLLYRWAGRTTGDATVLMAHYDVVPAPHVDSEQQWPHPPFEAVVTGSGADRVLWGRGTLDDKGALVALLEAVEAAAVAGFVPETDVYLAFGHNEETYGSGAQAIVAVLAERGIRPRLVLDEGGAIVQGILPGLSRPAAVIGVTEKGISTFRVSVEQDGGHASTPPRETATTRLASAVRRIADRPFPARLSPTAKEMLVRLGAHASPALRRITANIAVLERPLTLALTKLSPETNAMVRTTAAVTRLSGADADNALPELATATVNVRIAVGSSVAATERYLGRIVGPDARVTLVQGSEPSPVSPSRGPEWDRLVAAVEATAPDAIATPYVMMGGSDARHYAPISRSVYRFTPFRMSGAQRATLHAMGENITVATWLDGIRFYQRLLASS